MPDETEVSRLIDAMVLTPPDDVRRHRAALTVCVAMHSAGSDRAEIREVLDCLGLLSER